jgi:pimeloyl-ACP methyl ester carboxylesterase
MRVYADLASARGGQPPLDPKSDLPASPTPARPKRYRKDVPNAEVHIVDGGHFALDTAADEIAALVQGFVGSSREVVRDAAAKMKPL